VLREDVLLPPRSGSRPLGVYCVEQGRWNDGRRDFESKQSFAHPGLRREVYDKADQSRVWSEVARSARAAAAPSPTGSYQQVYEQPDVRAQLDEAEHGLAVQAAFGALGAAVFVGGDLAGLDVFRGPDLFVRQWRKLLRAYALEAASAAKGPSPEETQRAGLQRLLASAAAAPGASHANAGVGRIFEFRLPPRRGAALTHEATLIHAAIL